MYTKSIILAIIIYSLGACISMFVAMLIKGIFMGIKMRDKLQSNKRDQNWEGATVATKPS